jgi:hypothetical protein
MLLGELVPRLINLLEACWWLLHAILKEAYCPLMTRVERGLCKEYRFDMCVCMCNYTYIYMDHCSSPGMSKFFFVSQNIA